MAVVTAAGMPPTDLAAALHRWADSDRAAEAAVGLLIAHGHWLRREPFQRRVDIFQNGDDTFAAPNWESLHAMLRTGEDLYDSGSERAVLAVAISLAVGALNEAMTRCDGHNRALIVDAVAHAGGQP